MAANEVILVTGATGRLGRITVAALAAAGLRVRGFDRVPMPGVPEAVVGDLRDAAAMRRACADAGTLIHLAATPDDAPFHEELLPNNVAGLHDVLEAAAAAGARRWILASTGQVNWWQIHRGPWPVRVGDPLSPKGWYAVTKVALEAAGAAYAERLGIPVIAVRLGWCPRRGQVEEIAEREFGQDNYLSPRDAGEFFVRAVNADVPAGLHVVFATSRPARRERLDLEPARRLLGWTPRDTWPAGATDGL
ncbi:MAG TPA: NAD(P)-dependent oxidoreductase [Verrucomicrobiota bacterium]|nr:NAD(P)-dependent oxidoreductase [Verrucomicrobiota bacterium]